MDMSKLFTASVPALLAALSLSLQAAPVSAETDEVRVAEQFGIGYLPLQMMKHHGLFEKHAAAQGLEDVTMSWSRFSSGAAMNDALLSDNLDFASGGVGPLVTIWSKTKDNLGVKGVAALNSMPLYLNTNQPDVSSLEDLDENDRIALPAVKVSIQAVTLQMAAAQAFGSENYDQLDELTVSMKHPDGVAALLSGQSEITAHFTSAPFMYQELEDPSVSRVISSYDVLGGPATFNVVWARSSFREDNPKTYQAFVDALAEAMEMIEADRPAAAKVYIEETGSKLDPAFVEKIVTDPENTFSMVPNNTMKYADFMAEIGSIDEAPADWTELFFEDIHELSGS